MTLATPFIHAEPRDVEAVLRVSGFLLPLLLLLFLWLLATLPEIGELVGRLLLPSIYEQEWVHVFSYAFATIVFFLLGIGLFKVLERRGRWFESIIRRARLAQRKSIARLSARAADGVRLFVAYPYGDEARRALRIVDRIGELPYRAVIALGLATYAGFALLAYLYKYLWPLRVLTHTDVLPRVDVLSAVGMAVVTAVLALPLLYVLLFFPIVVLGVVRRVGYWDDSILNYAHTRLFVSSRIKTELRVVTRAYEFVPQSGGGAFSIQHSLIYGDATLLTDVAAWLARGAAPAPRSPPQYIADARVLRAQAFARIGTWAFYAAVTGGIIASYVGAFWPIAALSIVVGAVLGVIHNAYISHALRIRGWQKR